jgi:hypothetical protein
MPNWTYNYTTISGDSTDIQKLIDDTASDIDRNKLELTKVYPIPDAFDDLHQGHRTIDGESCNLWREKDDVATPVPEMEKIELLEKYGTYKSIDWQYNNWGTKWGDCQTQVLDNDGNKLLIKFESAWGEPFLLLNEIANKYNVKILNQWQIELDEGDGVTEYPIPNGDEVKKQHIKELQDMRNSIDNMFLERNVNE